MLINLQKYVCIIICSFYASIANSETNNLEVMITNGSVVEFVHADYFWLTAHNSEKNEDELYFCGYVCGPYDRMNEAELLKYEGKLIHIEWQYIDKYFPEGLDTLRVRQVISIEIDK